MRPLAVLYFAAQRYSEGTLVIPPHLATGSRLKPFYLLTSNHQRFERPASLISTKGGKELSVFGLSASLTCLHRQYFSSNKGRWIFENGIHLRLLDAMLPECGPDTRLMALVR